MDPGIHDAGDGIFAEHHPRAVARPGGGSQSAGAGLVFDGQPLAPPPNRESLLNFS
jgi:hypothetical protein